MNDFDHRQKICQAKAPLEARIKELEGALKEIKNGHEAVKMPDGLIKRCKLIRSQIIKIASQALQQEPERGGTG